MIRKLTKYKVITVFCKCGERLVKYKKGPWRTLLKIHRDRITKNYQWIFLENFEPEWTDIFCVNCKNRIATVKRINGKFINKVNRGSLGIIRKS
jgi:hypothetical protein